MVHLCRLKSFHSQQKHAACPSHPSSLRWQRQQPSESSSRQSNTAQSFCAALPCFTFKKMSAMYQQAQIGEETGEVSTACTRAHHFVHTSQWSTLPSSSFFFFLSSLLCALHNSSSTSSSSISVFLPLPRVCSWRSTRNGEQEKKKAKEQRK